MTLELLQFIRDNKTLTRTSVPNHTSHRKDMKYSRIVVVVVVVVVIEAILRWWWLCHIVDVDVVAVAVVVVVAMAHSRCSSSSSSGGGGGRRGCYDGGGYGEYNGHRYNVSIYQ